MKKKIILALIIIFLAGISIYLVQTRTPHDKTRPSDFKLSTPKDGALIQDRTPELIWKSSEDKDSGLDHYEIWIDGQNIENIPPPSVGMEKLLNLISLRKEKSKKTPSYWQTIVYSSEPLSTGEHTWKVIAVDESGNKQACNKRHNFRITDKEISVYDENNVKLGSGHFLWAIGGKLEHQECVDDTLVYNIGEDRWYKMEDMPQAVQGAGWTLYENKIYSFGGKTLPHKGASKLVQVYSIENDDWKIIDNMPHPRSKLGKFYPPVNDKIYLFGGDNESGRYNRVNWNWEYNLKTGKWKTDVKNAPYSQSFPVVTHHDNWLYFTSGNTGSKGPINDYPGALNQRYNPDSDEWEVKSPMPDPVTDGSGNKWNGEIHIIGGWDTNPGYDWVFHGNYDKHWIYNYENDSWRYGPDLPAEWHHQGVRSGENYLWNYLGRIGLLHVNKTFYWNGENWTEKNPAPLPGKMNFGNIYTTVGPVSTDNEDM